MEHNWKAKYKYVGYTASVAVAVDKKNKHRGQFESESKRHRRRRTRHQRHKRLAMETKHEGQLHKADTASSVSGWPWPSGDRFEKENLIRRALPKYLWISVGCWTFEVCCGIGRVLANILPVLILLVVILHFKLALGTSQLQRRKPRTESFQLSRFPQPPFPLLLILYAPNAQRNHFFTFREFNDNETNIIEVLLPWHSNSIS